MFSLFDVYIIKWHSSILINTLWQKQCLLLQIWKCIPAFFKLRICCYQILFKLNKTNKKYVMYQCCLCCSKQIVPPRIYVWSPCAGSGLLWVFLVGFFVSFLFSLGVFFFNSDSVEKRRNNLCEPAFPQQE